MKLKRAPWGVLLGLGAAVAASGCASDTWDEALARDVNPVDTHVHRVVSRLGVIGRPRTPEETFDRLQEVAPAGRALSLHVNLIGLGRELCRPRAPGCDRCPLSGHCAHAAEAGPSPRTSTQGG